MVIKKVQHIDTEAGKILHLKYWFNRKRGVIFMYFLCCLYVVLMYFESKNYVDFMLL